MSEEKNFYHIGEITAGFGIEIAGVNVWYDQGELVYVLAEVFDEEDSDFILWFIIMKSDSKEAQRINSDYVRIKRRGNVPRFPHFIEA